MSVFSSSMRLGEGQTNKDPATATAAASVAAVFRGATPEVPRKTHRG